jgi:nucleoid-associated protein YgaU
LIADRAARTQRKTSKEMPVNARRSLRFVFLAAAAVSMVAVGCSKNKTSARNDALDIAPPPQTYAQPQPVMAAQPQPVAQPVYDTQPSPQFTSQTPSQSSSFGGGNSYTVKKGDTLFSIAKNRYGNGNQWQKIAAANPGLSPQSLKAGQTINIPN